jgi:hypothetical protein
MALGHIIHQTTKKKNVCERNGIFIDSSQQASDSIKMLQSCLYIQIKYIAIDTKPDEAKYHRIYSERE